MERITKYSYLFTLVFVALSCSERRELTQYYPNGTVKSVWHFSSDTTEGVKEGYWNNGKLSYKFTYSRGRKNGEFQIFYRNGLIAEKGFFINDLRHGQFFEYFGTDSAKIKLEAYIIQADNEEYFYHVKEFNKIGAIIRQQKFLEVEEVSASHDLLLQYVGDVKYDSMKVVVGSYDYNFRKREPFFVDTLRFENNKATILGNHKVLDEDFLRGRFYGFKGLEVGDTVFIKTTIKFFEEGLPLQ